MGSENLLGSQPSQSANFWFSERPPNQGNEEENRGTLSKLKATTCAPDEVRLPVLKPTKRVKLSGKQKENVFHVAALRGGD